MSKQYYCTPDAMGLVFEIANRKIPNVLGKYQKLHGGERPPMPERRLKSLLLMRRLHYRFEEGDYRMTAREWGTVKEVGSWLISLHAQNEGHDDSKTWEPQQDFWQMEPPKPGTYAVVQSLILQS